MKAKEIDEKRYKLSVNVIEQRTNILKLPNGNVTEEDKKREQFFNAFIVEIVIMENNSKKLI